MKESRESLRRKRKAFPCRGAEDENGRGTDSGKSGTRNLETECQKQGGEYRRVCEAEAVTEIGCSR